MLQLSAKNIVVLVLKPSEDNKAWIVTLFNPADKTASTTLHWAGKTRVTSYSNTAETAEGAAPEDLVLASLEVMTLRVEK